jgi:carbonic anhydrase/acetyltransferase-like protein (isoleucine patch superfamily)
MIRPYQGTMPKIAESAHIDPSAQVIGDVVVGAGALVPEGMDMPANTLVMGTPAKVKRAVTADEHERFKQNCQNKAGNTMPKTWTEPRLWRNLFSGP